LWLDPRWKKKSGCGINIPDPQHWQKAYIPAHGVANVRDPLVVEVVVGVVQQQFLTAEASLRVILLLYRKEEKQCSKSPPRVFLSRLGRCPVRLLYRLV
jgi:hypothetical protein